MYGRATDRQTDVSANAFGRECTNARSKESHLNSHIIIRFVAIYRKNEKQDQQNYANKNTHNYISVFFFANCNV